MRYMIKLKRENENIVRLRVKRKVQDEYAKEYWLSHDKLWRFFCSPETGLVLSDGYDYVEFRKGDAAMSITTTHINPHLDGKIDGRQDTFSIPLADIGGFLCCSETGDEDKWLNNQPPAPPKIIIKDSKNLHALASHPLYRHKFAKFIGSAFRWRCAAIELYNDFVPYSFYFKEKYVDGSSGICGGVILHGQDDPPKAYYSIHT